MNKRLSILCIAILSGCSTPSSIDSQAQQESIPDMHTSKNALDWTGMYQGVLPCADCDGIKTSIMLTSNQSFVRTVLYLGKEKQASADQGSFQWADQGSIIVLNSHKSQTQQSYQVAENALYHLDRNNQRIKGDLQEMYVLKRTAKDAKLEGQTWKLETLLGHTVEMSERPNKQAYIEFDPDSGRFYGSTSCNRISGTYSVATKGRLSFGPAQTTMMACPNMEIEKTFTDALEKTKSYQIENNKLILKAANNSTLAKFVMKQNTP